MHRPSLGVLPIIITFSSWTWGGRHSTCAESSGLLHVIQADSVTVSS